MGLEEYDLYAIKQYSFTVRKTNNFFSLPTVILSLLVFGVAISINLNTIRHLWLPFEDLEVQSASSLELPGALTSTLMCFKPSSAANINRYMFFRKDLTPLSFPSVAEN